MPFGSSKITLSTLSGSDSVQILYPKYGYSVDCNLAIDFVEGLNWLDSFDNGSKFDFRELKMKLDIPEGQAKDLHDFFNDTDARYNKFNLIVELGKNFYPAGPDKGGSNTYTVSLNKKKISGAKEKPWMYFDSELSLIVHTFSTSLSSQIIEGPLLYGSLNGYRFPKASPAFNQKITRSNSISGVNSYVDIGKNSDTSTAKISQQCGFENAGNLVNFLSSQRNSEFTITAPENYYLFGIDGGSSGAYTCKLMDNKIEIAYINYNIWEVTFSIWRVS